MSVTIHGVKGYKYQYRLTVLIALLYNRSQGEKLFAEMIGSEDITFIDANDNVLEIQTKMEKKDLNLPLLIDWLLHFQEYDDYNNLLRRIVDKKSRCLFITRSRCTDETSIFLNAFADISVKNTAPAGNYLKSLRETISQTPFKKTQLGVSRKKNSEALAENITDEELEHLINNTWIWEQVDEGRIDDQVLLILNKKYSVPQSQVETLYLNLLKIVEDGKDTKNDILPSFNSSIAAVQVNKFTLHQFYIPRGHEQKAQEVLHSNNSLLLTGVSQCGKTEIAKKIANTYVDNGFNKVRSTSELLAIENFLNQNPSESKIAIIEDPFGHIKPKEGVMEIKKRITDICRGLPAHHKLIITSRAEILEEAFPLSVLTEFTTVNITEHDTDEILHFWNEFSQKFQVSEKVTIEIRDYIAKEEKNKLQIGQLEYLAKYDKISLSDKSLSELVTIARHNSIDIASDLTAENLERANVLGLLSICCSNSIAVNYSELKYVFSKDKTKYSVFGKQREFALIKSESKYPEYSTLNKIPKHIKACLSYFEERGFIRSDDKTIIFSHPNYFEAARLLFIRKSNDEQKKNLKYLKKTLSCINPVTARFACKELYHVYKKIDNSLREKVRDLMLFANQSIYPSVEDIALINLSYFLDDFTDSSKKDDVVHIISVGNTDSGSIQWHNDEIPYIGKDTSFSRGFRDIPDKKIADEIEEKLALGGYVSVRQAWDYVNYYQWQSFSRRSFKIDADIIVSLMRYDEVFIRKQAAKIFFSAKIEPSEKYLIDKVLRDSHPTVIFYAIWGALRYWIKQDIEVKLHLFKIIKILFGRQEIAIRSNDLISTFSVDYSGECIDWESFSEQEKKELWNVWGEIFPIFSNSVPASIYINVGRFGATMTAAMKYLTYENGLRVFNAWYDRIEYKIRQNAAVSDYEIAIIEDLIDFTGNDHTARRELFNKIVNNKDSGLLLYNLKNVIKHYDKLHIEEKTVIQNLVESERSDTIWIHAQLLSMYEVPKSLLLIATGGIDITNLKPKEILEKLPDELIHNCLKIIYRRPYKLYLLSPDSTEFWDKIINYILFYQITPYFSLCVEEFIGTNIWGSRTKNFLLWRKICLNTKDLDYLLYLVLYNISSSTIYIQGTCDIISGIKYAYESRGKLQEFTLIIAENIEVIQLRHKEDIFEYFSEEYIFTELISAIHPDRLAKLVLEKVGAIGLPPLFEHIDSFRFFHTYNVIKRVLNKDTSLDPETKSRLLALPNNIETVGKQKQNVIATKFLIPDIEINNWNSNVN